MWQKIWLVVGFVLGLVSYVNADFTVNLGSGSLSGNISQSRFVEFTADTSVVGFNITFDFVANSGPGYILLASEMAFWITQPDGKSVQIGGDDILFANSKKQIWPFYNGLSTSASGTYTATITDLSLSGNGTWRFSIGNGWTTTAMAQYNNVVVTAITPIITSVTVSPKPINLFVGGTGQASVTVAPLNANQQVTWRSGNTSIATVSSTGVVTGTGFGSTTISAVSNQDASKTDSLTVNVSDPLVFTLSNPTNTFLTGSTAGTSMVVDRGLTVSGASVFGGTVSIVGGFVRVQDVLSATDQGGISGSYNSSTGVLTLSGTATAAQYQSFLRTVTYINTQDSPYVGTRTLRFSLNFGIPVRPIAQEVTFPVNVFGSNQTIFFGTMF